MLTLRFRISLVLQWHWSESCTFYCYSIVGFWSRCCTSDSFCLPKESCEEIDQTLPPLNLNVASSCNCFDHENCLCLASFPSHRDPEDEDGEERIVDPLRDLLTNSEDEEDESDSDPDSQSRRTMLIPVIAPRSRSSWNISLSLGQTGRNDIRKVLTSVMNWELKRKWYQSELNMNLRTLQIVMH